MVPLYILGLIKRYGPQHGYQIRKTIAEQLADFTQIKLPTIYYHLTKMASDGLLTAASEKPGARPEKTVYSVTDKGEAAYRKLLAGLLQAEYRPAFVNDAVFYFSDHNSPAELRRYLQHYTKTLRNTLGVIGAHRKETLLFVPDDARTMVDILFSHHEHHYKAELSWALETLRGLHNEGGTPDGETEDT